MKHIDDLTKLPNIGAVLADKLRRAGIPTFDSLVDIGSVEALLRIGEEDDTACYNMFYAIEGAIRGVRWHAIPADDRRRLKEELDRARSAGHPGR